MPISNYFKYNMHVRAWDACVYDPHSWRTEMGPLTYTNTAMAHKIGTEFRKNGLLKVVRLEVRLKAYRDIHAATIKTLRLTY